MARKACHRCGIARTAAVALLLGGSAGWAANHHGLSSELSMLATFAGAFLPVLWFARRRSRD